MLLPIQTLTGRWAMALVLLAGCAAAPAPEAGLRVLVKLPPKSGAADNIAWLMQLQQSAGVPVTHAAFVSPTWSAYWLLCGDVRERCDAALAALRSSGVAESVLLDGDKRAH